LLTCAHALNAYPRSRDHRKEQSLRALVGTAGALQRARAVVWRRRSGARTPDTRLGIMIAREQRRYHQALKIVRRLDDQYRDSPDPALAPLAVQARIEMVPALIGLGRLREMLTTMESTIRAGESGIAAFQAEEATALGSDRRNPWAASAGFHMLRAMAVEQLGDRDRTIAVYDEFIERFKDDRSPTTRLLLRFAHGFRRRSHAAGV
jgi:hypothetical protein